MELKELIENDAIKAIALRLNDFTPDEKKVILSGASFLGPMISGRIKEGELSVDGAVLLCAILAEGVKAIHKQSANEDMI